MARLAGRGRVDCFFVVDVFSKQVENFIPEGQNVTRVGQVRIYDDTTADLVKAEFPSERVLRPSRAGATACCVGILKSRSSLMVSSLPTRARCGTATTRP